MLAIMSYPFFLPSPPPLPLLPPAVKEKEGTEFSVLGEVSEEADFRTASKQSFSVARGALVCPSPLPGVGRSGVGPRHFPSTAQSHIPSI